MSSPPDRRASADGTRSAPPATEEFTDADARELARLLAKFANHKLDRHELWKLEFRWGSVYVDISRRPPQGASEFAYARIWPPLPDPRAGV